MNEFPRKVCILAAGSGTRMGPLSDVTHKALLPLGPTAILSLIISKFPQDTHFVMPLGHKSGLLKDFLSLAHPRNQFTFVTVDRPAAGPGYSLYCCREFLHEPFIFTACDTLLNSPIPKCDHNWIAVQKVMQTEKWCCVALEKDRVVQFFDKAKDAPSRLAYTGIAFVKDHQEFWEASKHLQIGAEGEIQTSLGLTGLIPKGLEAREVSWEDTGDFDQYEKIGKKAPSNLSFFGKTNEITYRYGDKIIKFIQNAADAELKFERARRMGGPFPKVIERRGNFFTYHFVPGRILGEVLNGRECSLFLNWAWENFWKPAEIGAKEFRSALEKFYVDKTLKRLADFEERTMVKDREPVRLNGVQCDTVRSLLGRATPRLVSGGIPSRFHGDLHAGNIVKGNGEYILLDWRQDFGGLADVGDLAYDLSKFLHTLDFSGEAMAGGQYSLKAEDENVFISHPGEARLIESRTSFIEFCKSNDLDLERIEIINALIFINMAPLYPKALGVYLYFLGRLLLQKAVS